MELLKPLSKNCPKCANVKHIGDFYNQRNTKDGKTIWCKSCTGANSKRWKMANPDKFKDSKLRARFGISLEQYNAMFAEQLGRCNICERHQTEFRLSLAVDHCHKTGVVRSLLCGSCNTMIGNAGEKPGVLRKAAEYIETHLVEDK